MSRPSNRIALSLKAVGFGGAVMAVLWAVSSATVRKPHRPGANPVPAPMAASFPTDAPVARPCRMPLDRGVAATVEGLRSAAVRSSLTLSGLEIEDGAGPAELPTDLLGATLRLQADGSEQAMTSFLAASAAGGLPLYPESVELKRSAGRVHLELVGGVLCRRGAR